MPQLTQEEDGFVLATAVMLLGVIMLITIASVTAATTFSHTSGADRNAKRALAAAQAGTAIATYRLNAIGASQTQCFADGAIDLGSCPKLATGNLGNNASYDYYVSPPLTSSTPCAGLWVQSVKALLQRCVTVIAQRRVQQRIVAYAAPPRWPINGMLGLNGITGSGVVQITGDIGSNGPMKLPTSGSSITGTVRPGTSTSTYAGPTPTGGVANPPPAPYAASVDSSAFANSATTNDNASLNPLPTNLSLNQYREVGATNKVGTATAPWTLQSGTYNFCQMSFNNDTYIALAPGARVHIYIDSPYRSGSGCRTNTGNVSFTGKLSWENSSNDPTALQIDVYGDPNCSTASCGSSVKFNNTLNTSNGPFYGTINAPQSTFTNTNVANFAGGIVANQITLSNTFVFNAQGLAGTSGSGTEQYYAAAWKECPSHPTTSDPTSGC